MGKTSDAGPTTKTFGPEQVKDKALVLEMLGYEDTLIHGEEAQATYKAFRAMGHHSMDVERMTGRQTLAHFGYSTDDDSLANYRTINRSYYKSPTDYDPDVLKAVTYLRANRCLRYLLPLPSLGDTCPNPVIHPYNPLLDRCGPPQALHSFFDLSKSKRIVAAFSSS